LAGLAAWLVLYTRIFGTSFLAQEWGGNTWGRAAGQAWSSNLAFNSRFYLDVFRTLAPYGLGALALSLLQFGYQARIGPEKGRRWAGAFCLVFLLVWGLGMLSIHGFSMNYVLPLLTFACLGLAPLLAAPRPGGAAWLRAALALVLLFLSWSPALAYVHNPPDPNGALVDWLGRHPARSAGQPMVLVGQEVDGQVIEFYSRYHVQVLAALPRERPCELTLVSMRDRSIQVFPEIVP
jgi:hypothetical protein